MLYIHCHSQREPHEVRTSFWSETIQNPPNHLLGRAGNCYSFRYVARRVYVIWLPAAFFKSSLCIKGQQIPDDNFKCNFIKEHLSILLLVHVITCYDLDLGITFIGNNCIWLLRVWKLQKLINLALYSSKVFKLTIYVILDITKAKVVYFLENDISVAYTYFCKIKYQCKFSFIRTLSLAIISQ